LKGDKIIEYLEDCKDCHKQLTEDFECWFAVNHPWDWWKKQLGKPVYSMVRLLVHDLCKRAHEDGFKAGMKAKV
jgi:hypothetical protein